MSSPYRSVFQRLSAPLAPIPAPQAAVLRSLRDVRAVLFDLYGTLLVSGSGEVGTEAVGGDAALAEALAAVGMARRGPMEGAIACFFDTIRAMHDESRAEGRDWPEVDVREVWRRVVAELAARGMIEPTDGGEIDLARLAVEYEARANPVWPMPGARECLATLQRCGVVLGVISNAQFFTPILFEALFGQSPESIGFDRDLQYYSYQHGWGKPSLRLFELAARRLAARAIGSAEVVYVGNDMLNDIAPAQRVGFRTALFAGDARSLRLRVGDLRVEGVVPDVVLTELGQLTQCMFG